MLGKLINGVLITPSKNERKKIVITNPTDDILKYVMGYKDLFYDEEPEYNPETQYLEMELEETTDAVKVHWVIKEVGDTV